MLEFSYFYKKKMPIQNTFKCECINSFQASTINIILFASKCSKSWILCDIG